MPADHSQNRQLPYQARAYGLDIQSGIELPEFLPSQGGSDVTVPLDHETAPDCGRQQWSIAADIAECCFSGVGRFRISQGSQIRVTAFPGVAPELLRLYVEGMMMAILLHQRGYFVLHSSMVEIDGRGVAFVGPVGAGKSSLAMAMHALGGRLVADDNAAVRISSGAPCVLPAFPRVKLYPDIAAALGIHPDKLAGLHATQAKKTTLIENGFATAPVPLHRIYALSREPSPTRKLSRPEAAVELIKHSIPARWGLPGTAEQLRECAYFSGLVPIYRIRTFDSPCLLRDVADSIATHLRPPVEHTCLRPPVFSSATPRSL
jgi:hypothetical protein